MNSFKSHTIKLKAKKVFLSKGTCSQTFFYILNREFGHPKPNEEIAIDPLAGGILKQGYQCGMLWGASMAVGAEAYRRYEDLNQATYVAIKATQQLMESFEKITHCIDCKDFTKINITRKWGLVKFMASGKFFSCFKLAEKWAPESINAAIEGLQFDTKDWETQPTSCASKVVKQMGGTDEEAVMVAGFAGGMGLCGSGCGALAACIWKTILELVKKGEWKASLNDRDSEAIVNKFYELTDYKMTCSEICEKKFNSIDEHSEHVKNGGCEKLINTLSVY